ncbi:MAG: hypothetical protein KGQ38_06580 [Actinomycetales bacterium]|nr:hypothetical protein [Actinomycetales bacterium]
MNKKFLVAFTAVAAMVFSFFTNPAKADAQWVTGLQWSNLHVKNENGVFENWHREWKIEKPTDLFAPDKIDYNSETQHNLAWVRTDRNSFTSTYVGGLSQAGNQVSFVFQGYNGDGDPMDYQVEVPGAAPVPQPSIKNLVDGPTYYDVVTATADGEGNAQAVITLKKTAQEFDSIVVSLLTQTGTLTPVVVDKEVVVKKKPLTKKTVTNITYTPVVGAAPGTIYQYSLNGGTSWENAPSTNFNITQTANPVSMRTVLTVGAQVITWQKAGWRPIIKLVGTPTGRQCQMDVPTINLCSGIDFRDQTFDWSVANRPWFKGSQTYDYAQAYAKSYTPGSTVALKFLVRDVWGNPIKKLPLSISLKGASSKWSKYPSTIKTDDQGYATFSAKNLNTVAQINAHVDVNPDPPHKKTRGIVGFVVYVTSNEIDEVADQMWFQLASDITIAGGCPNTTNSIKCPPGGAEFPIDYRGPNATNFKGNYYPNPTSSPNPALTLDSEGTSLNDVIIGALNITRLKNLQSQFIWAPEVKITATNGGLSAVATAAQKDNAFSDFKSSANFKAVTTFGYTYYQDLVFMATQPGTTTWTVSVGKWKYSFSQDYVAP